MSVFIFIVLLVLLILVHEFGHFIVAKICGMRVDEFGVGFPPRLASITKGETRYSINLLPFGGFVRIFGEQAGEGAGNPRSFTGRPRLAQAAVVLAGITFNLLFAWLALSLGYMVGLPTAKDHVGFGEVQQLHTTIVDVYPNSPAAKVGILPEDTVVSVETGTAKLTDNVSAEAVQNFIASHENESAVVTVQRKGELKIFLAKPEAGIVPDHKVIGMQLDDVGILRLAPHLALLEGGILAEKMTVSTAQGLFSFFASLFSGHASLSQVSGPIGIVGIGAGAVHEGFSAAIILIALISINLAIINLLPIPGLDGGRLLFIIIESVQRKPMSEKITFGLTALGFAFLVALIVVVSYHDITKLISHP